MTTYTNAGYSVEYDLHRQGTTFIVRTLQGDVRWYKTTKYCVRTSSCCPTLYDADARMLFNTIEEAVSYASRNRSRNFIEQIEGWERDK